MHVPQPLSRGGRLLVAVVVGAALFGVASAVQADIPDSGVIHGCYGRPGTTYKGQLRVRDASQGEQCRSYENQLDWNQAGPTGARGATGPTGPTEGENAVGTVGVTPPATLTDQLVLGTLESTVTTALSGKLYLSKAFDAAVDCTDPASTSVWWWITLDGSPVRGSLAFTDDGTTRQPQTLVGVTSSVVAAGVHKLNIGAMCFSGAAGPESGKAYSGGAVIVLG